MIASCNSPSNNKTTKIGDSLLAVRVEPDTTDKTIMMNQRDFNVNRFITLADSLLTSIERKPFHFSCIIDTIPSDISDEYSYYYALHPSDKTLVKRYSFDPGRGNRMMHLWFIDASYSDTSDLNKAFKALKVRAYENTEPFYIPGLTYTNDYVVRTDKNIYWLNSGCPYAFFNHKKLIGLISQSLDLDNVVDSIHCKCGMPKCKL